MLGDLRRRPLAEGYHYGRITALNRAAIGAYSRNADKVPFTIEILGLDHDRR